MSKKAKNPGAPNMVPSTLIMTTHATQRFRDRIEVLDHEVVQEWCQEAWRRRKHMDPLLKTHILRREYGGISRDYLSCRSPGGRAVFLALSADRSVVTTVFDTWHWNLFTGTRPTKEVRNLESIIRQLRARDRIAGKTCDRIAIDELQDMEKP
jgi:hypothetical protein